MSDTRPLRRVLMTTDAVGGVWDYALELGRGLGDAGVEVVLAAMGPPPDEAQAAAAAAIPGLELHVGRYRLEWMEDSWADVAAAGGWLLELAARRQVDLVHLNGFVHGALPFPCPKLVVGHSCVLSWWRAVRKATAPAGWQRYREAVTAGLRAADRVVAPTAWMREALRAHYGPLAAEVIPNGRSAVSYRPGRKEPFVLSAGRLWDEAKNARALARVAHRLPWPVRIAGAVRMPGAAGASAFPADDFANVTCLGRLAATALAAQYAAATIYALPARYEPFGLTALEAALAGAVLILGDIPSLRELWQDAALFVAPDDEDALAFALIEAMSRPDLRASLAARARARAGGYSAGQMVNRYLACYGNLLAPARAPHDREEELRACVS